ncbi:hypothetical protein BDY19DRAFT_998594 [Irpex rosettiformis]|uniref:Uncharacterized protein n=1 Tax=Irpex rosettiformis TaxID=378272 RepID=A0ACB8TN21_9APHY|nr:hypothetical protein BDY19DRAFT_998594 [Irpex rosettiformis]
MPNTTTFSTLPSPRRSMSPDYNPPTTPPPETYIRTHMQSPPTIQVIPDRGPNSLPIAGSKSAPPKFSGDFSKIKDFIAHYEKLCALKRVLNDTDKIQNIGQYCSKRVRNFLEGLSSYHARDWLDFKTDFLKYYDAERDEKRYKEKDLSQYVKHTHQKDSFTTLSTWKQYDRGFIRIAGWLRAKNKITTRQLDVYFWKGIPRTLRARIEHRLVMVYPDHSFSDPFSSNEVRKIAESLLQRSRFDEEVLPSDDESDDNSDLSMSDSDNDRYSDSSDDESSDEERATQSRKSKSKHTKHSSKKGKTSTSSKKVKFDTPPSSRTSVPSDTERAPIRTTRSPSPAIKSTSERAVPRARTTEPDVDGLIDRLSHMSINDPQYAGLFLRVCTINPYAKDAIESLQRQRALQAQATSPAPQQQPQPFRNRMPMRENVRNTYLDNMMCYGCGDTGHPMSECLKLAELVNQGIIQRVNGRVCWINGNPVRRQPEESWVSAINRQHMPTSNFASIIETECEQDYCSEYELEEDMDIYETEPEESLVYNVQYVPYDTDYNYEQEADGYAAARPERTIRGARKEQFDGVYAPARKELEQQRAKTRSMDNNTPRVSSQRPPTPSPVPQPVASNAQQPFQTVQPQRSTSAKTSRPPGIPAKDFNPSNRTQYRSNFDPNDSDQLMEDIAIPKAPVNTPPSVKPKTTPRVNRNEPDPEHKERTTRRSDIQNQVDSSEVLNKLLKTPITLAVGEVLGVSKEMSQQLQEAIKVKTTRCNPGVGLYERLF